MTHTIDHLAQPSQDDGPSLELSVVIPCLNESETIEGVVRTAVQALAERGVCGEVVVADNGSTDGSDELATKAGARVVRVEAKGYGNALIGGINAARGRCVLMGDADGQHDFRDIGPFIDKLREGYELVQGCRLPSGGGRVMPGAMPFTHRWIGNPMFSWMARNWYGASVHDVYCGMRAFRKDLLGRLNLKCTGMEFAIEMILKASLNKVRVAEAPITVYPDGRSAHAAHIRTFRDGWRTLRFFLLNSPRWLFLIPGLALVLLGVLGYAAAFPAFVSGRVEFSVQQALLASLMILCGYQSVLFSLLAKTFAVNEGLLPDDPRLDRLFAAVDLEKGLIVGAVGLVVGLALFAGAVIAGAASKPPAADHLPTLRWAIPGTTLVALGFQTILSSFLASIVGMKRR